MSKFEQFESEQEQPSIYDVAADLARQKIAMETSDDKQAKSKLKNKIKETFGSIDTLHPEKTPPTRKIFDLELERQQLLIRENQALKEVGKDLDLPVEHTRPLMYENGNFYFRLENNREIELTLGDLMSDINWNRYYELPAEVPADVKKKYLEAVYNARLDKLRDQQLIIEHRDILKLNEKVYNEMESEIERGWGESAGKLFEHMALNLMHKVAIDLAEWGIKVFKATVVEDAEDAIDFWIVIPKMPINHLRGVSVIEEDVPATADEDNMETGKVWRIQFTIKNLLAEKQRRISKVAEELNLDVNDYLLVSVPIAHDEIFSRYKKWQHQDKLPGGPENMLPDDIKNGIVKQCLQRTELIKDPAFIADLDKKYPPKK